MEIEDARLFQREAASDMLGHGRKIVELEVLESRRQLRLKVNELIQLANKSTITTNEIRQELLLGIATFGHQLSIQLVRSLHREDPQECQSIVWLLTLLNDAQTIIPLQHMSIDKRLPRPVRLSASLALAGMGVTAETIDKHRRVRLYAIS